MDHEKYYDIRGDSYVIHFPNFHGISVEEIEKMFSVYGPMSVDTRSGQYGLCFIRYQNLEDTINCLNGFKDHKSIKILRHKNKIGKDSMKKNSTNKKQKTNIPGLFDTKETDREESSNKFQNDKQFDFNDLVGGRDSDHNSSIASTSSLVQLLKMKQIHKKRSSSVVSSEISDNNSMIMANSLNEDEIPSLTYNNKKTVQAQEVIIANIHPDLGAQEILTLFKDYHPICITFIKEVPDTEIRYCHAYFMSARDALAIEKKFDKYLLRERVLIVLRPQMLIEEAFFM